MIVEKFARKSSIITRYKQNKQNLGYDGNTFKAFSMARGEYVHLVSDEDLYHETQLLEFVRLLKDEKPDCILLASHMKKWLKLPKSPVIWHAAHKGEFLDRILSLHGKGFLHMGFISCMIIRTSFFRRFKKMNGGGPGKFFGLGYLPLPVYVCALNWAEKMVVTLEMFQEKENFSNPLTPIVIAMPHIYFKLMHCFFSTMHEARLRGMLSKAQYDLFLHKFFTFSLFNTFEIRTYMCPEVFALDRENTIASASLLANDYSLSGWRRQLFNLYLWLLYLPLPYHWIYAAWAWRRIRLMGDDNVFDVHKAYRKMLAGKGKFVKFYERDPTWKK